jgi:uncharacterized protein (DUF2336 family)
MAVTSLIPGLDDIVRHGAPARRQEATRRIAGLFFDGAAELGPQHVALFDGLLIDLVPHADLPTRADLAERLSWLAQAPRALVGRLARDDAIMVAGPLLRRSPVVEHDVLLEVARTKGQEHLLALSERPSLHAELTDLLVRRGDRAVVRRLARNASAQVPPAGDSELIGCASSDDVLTLAIGRRADLSDPNALPADARTAGRRRFAPARRTVRALYHAGGLNESALLGFARDHQYEEAVTTLAAMSGLEIATLDRLVSGPRHDPILIVGRTVGLAWTTVHALILMRLRRQRITAQADIEMARISYARLLPTTAERVVAVWKARP